MLKKISRNILKDLYLIKSILADNYDVVIREFTIGDKQQVEAFIVFIDGLIQENIVNDSILRPLMIDIRDVKSNDFFDFNSIKKSALATANVREVETVGEAVQGIVSGNTALFLSISDKVLLIDNKGFESRGIEKPEMETVIRGPKESFGEVLQVNTALLRRKIKNSNLKLEKLKIGEQTQTDICIAYIKGIANEEIVCEVKNRLKDIKIDSVLESGYLEEFIEDAPFSPFPTIANTEKPDTVAGKILEGRVAIFVDGTPTVLTVPHIFIEGLMVSEDYYSRPYFVSIIRLVRLGAMLMTMLLPSLYIAIVTFHPELLPVELAISLAVASEGVPFPAFMEVFIMGLLFEVLREAGVRMPRAVGQAVSIVGALILGDAAIRAGIVGAPVVIVTALTAISSFVVPAQLDVLTMLRLVFVVIGTVMGLPGIMIAIIAVVIHMGSLRSFGVPYMVPLAPFFAAGWKDFVVRVPWWAMTGRPHLIGTERRQRQKPGQRPSPYDEEIENG
ncbi:MAG: spore germination protein [Bacillota bacterium]